MNNSVSHPTICYQNFSFKSFLWCIFLNFTASWYLTHTCYISLCFLKYNHFLHSYIFCRPLPIRRNIRAAQCMVVRERCKKKNKEKTGPLSLCQFPAFRMSMGLQHAVSKSWHESRKWKPCMFLQRFVSHTENWSRNKTTPYFPHQNENRKTKMLHTVVNSHPLASSTLLELWSQLWSFQNEHDRQAKLKQNWKCPTRYCKMNERGRN